MQWDAGKNAGFTSGTPWITPPENYRTINAEAEAEDEDSILQYYKELIRLRKELPVISEGQIAFLCQDRADVFAYRRFLGDDELLVFNNLTGNEVLLSDVPCPAGYRKLIGNYPDAAVRDDRLVLRPYESIVYRA